MDRLQGDRTTREDRSTMTVTPITRLQALRRVRELSQEQVAERMGVSRTTLARVESGEYGIDRYAADLAAALEIPERMDREAAGELDREAAAAG